MVHPTKIIGHNEQLKILNESYHVKFPHAWIFNGIKGIGKYSTAVSFVRSVCKIEREYSPNYFEINSEENPVLVDDIRLLINQINLTNANENQNCFIIIDNANSLNFNSYNAMLKTIEDPPSNTIIIIISHNIKKIPKTISSRCIKLDFKALSKKDMFEFCKYNKIECKHFDLEKNYFLTNGSIERLFFLISEEGKIIQEYFDDLEKNKSFKMSEFELFYDHIAHNYDKLFSSIMNHIFFTQKSRFLKYYQNKTYIKKILMFFSNIRILYTQNLNIDKKKELYYLLSEYIKTNEY
tara:strand:- start:115 stop:999 length:885 start_codon:yes stop_codon:yes gene_type:complete